MIGPATGSGRERWRRLLPGVRLAALVVVIVLIVGVAAAALWGSSRPSKQDLMEQAGLTGKRELLVGVMDDQPGISQWNPATEEFEGFDIAIAYLVTADLGFRRNEVRFLPLESEDRPKMQARDNNRFVTVDLVVASYSITEDREKLPNVSFSAAYLETEQSVITRQGHRAVQSFADLRDKPVCSITTSTSEPPAELSGVEYHGRNEIHECVDGVRSGEYEAATTDAAILAGFVARDPAHLMHHDIGLAGQEEYGINTGGNEALRDLVNLSLYHSLHDPQDQRWEDAFDKYLRPEQQVNLPQQVAIDQQPAVPKVEVREWPWERDPVAPAAIVGIGPTRTAGRRRGRGRRTGSGWAGDGRT